MRTTLSTLFYYHLCIQIFEIYSVQNPIYYFTLLHFRQFSDYLDFIMKYDFSKCNGTE